MLVVFFFQAEDGIRYWSVTGVQTCALPISPRSLVFPVIVMITLPALMMLGTMPKNVNRIGQHTLSESLINKIDFNDRP